MVLGPFTRHRHLSGCGSQVARSGQHLLPELHVASLGPHVSGCSGHRFLFYPPRTWHPVPCMELLGVSLSDGRTNHFCRIPHPETSLSEDQTDCDGATLHDSWMPCRLCGLRELLLHSRHELRPLRRASTEQTTEWRQQHRCAIQGGWLPCWVCGLWKMPMHTSGKLLELWRLATWSSNAATTRVGE